MNKRVAIILLVAAVGLLPACTSKLVRIDSSPAFADIEINDEHIGKTPVYYRFRDIWYPWPIQKAEDYSIVVQLDGYKPAVELFKDTPPALDISYVPDEIFFEMEAAETETAP